MIATATAVMYALTYTNVFAFEHIRFSEERVYMALTMGAGMAIVMLSYMWAMHPNVRANVGIILGALVLGIVAFFLSQSQILVRGERPRDHRSRGAGSAGAVLPASP